MLCHTSHRPGEDVPLAVARNVLWSRHRLQLNATESSPCQNENTEPKKGRRSLQLYKTIFTVSVSNGYLELNDLFHVILIEQIFTEYLLCPRY